MHLFPSPYNTGPQACESLGESRHKQVTTFVFVSVFLHLLIVCGFMNLRHDGPNQRQSGRAVINVNLVSVPAAKPAAPAPTQPVATPKITPAEKPAKRIEPVTPAEKPAEHSESATPAEKIPGPVKATAKLSSPSPADIDETTRPAVNPVAIAPEPEPKNRLQGTAAGSTAATSTTGPAAPAQATASPGSISPGQQYLDENFYYIKDLITRNLIYPVVARRMKWQGTVVVFFVVRENGAVENISVVTSSGHKVLDKNVLATIRQVQPFPAPPVSAEVTMPIKYTLKR